MCMLEPDVFAEVWNEKRPTARTDKLCDCCLRVIHKGTAYLAVFVVAERNANSSIACPDCEKIIDRFQSSHGFRFSPDDIGWQLADCISESDDDSEWIQDLDWINLGRWLRRKNKFNRTIQSLPPVSGS